jgi:hypothetical protein
VVEEAVPVVLLRLAVPGPVGGLEVLEDDPDVLPLLRGVGPHVELALPAARRCLHGALEPGVLIRGVVDHELGDDLEPAGVCLVDEALELPHRPVVAVDRGVVRDVVAVVAAGRGVEGQQPQRGDPEVLQVVELGRQPREIADAVTVGVEEGPHVQLVDDGVLVPLAVVGGAGCIEGHSGAVSWRAGRDVGAGSRTRKP